MAGAQQQKLRLIALGGTIAFVPGLDGAVPQLEGRDLVASLHEGSSIDVLDLATVSSIAITDQHLLQLASAVAESLAEGYDGVVITHGTDTLEETAYFLALTTRRGRAAVVLTGAMRHTGLPGFDGPANLHAAVLAAQSPDIADVGTVVVMEDEIHAARFVTKSHTSKLSAFVSSTGPLGQLMEGRTEVWFQPRYEDYLGTVSGSALPRVELVTMTSGHASAGLTAIIDSQPAGLVIAGLGGGHVPPQLLSCIDQAVARGIPVVVASRCGDGPTLSDTYGVPGAEIDLQDRGAVMGGLLSGPKARLRLAVALAIGLPATSAFPA
jgi:L-asparaginase